MRHLFLYLLAALLLGAGPARALNPIANVIVPSGQTTTFTGASVASEANYYRSIEIQSGGTGVFNDAEYVNTLLVRTGGTLVFGSAGEARSPSITSDSPPSPSITLEPGAAVQLANPAGLPFAQGSYTGNTTNGMIPAPAYTLTISPTVRYLFNGTAAQTTAAPAPRASGGTAAASASGVALPAAVGRLSLNNAAGLTLVNNTGVSQELHLTNGQLTAAAGATLTLLSTSAGTGVLDIRTGSGTLSGSFAVQRYIDNGTNTGTGYRHLAAPVAGQTVASFANGTYSPRVNPAYNSNPASVPAASFPTVFSYDETKVGGSVGTVGFNQGWQSPAALTDALVPGRGYTVNTPPTAATGATLTFTGAPRTTALNVTGLGHTTANGGFQLLGNPFAAPLDWDAVANANFLGFGNGRPAAALYVFKSSGPYAGSYTTYVPTVLIPRPAGRAAAAGTNVVPSGQAFFVYVSNVGSSADINFAPSSTINSYASGGSTPVQRPLANTRAYLSLTLQDAAQAHAHTTLVYFDAAATSGFDAAYDGLYLAGPGQAVSLTTALAGQEYAINALPALGTADVAVPLHLSAAAAGTYTLAVDTLTNLPATTRAYLLDAATGQRQELTATSQVQVTLAAGTPVSARYSLLFTSSTALATAPAALAQLAGLYPNPARGQATLVLPASLRAGQPVPVELLNSLGQVVRQATATADELALPLDGLATGLYTVQARTAAGTIARRLTVE